MPENIKYYIISSLNVLMLLYSHLIHRDEDDDFGKRFDDEYMIEATLYETGNANMV